MEVLALYYETLDKQCQKFISILEENIDQYQNSEDAIAKWIATVHAIGITKENGQIKVYAPYGLSDIFSRTIRPIKHKGNSQELYNKKVASWQSRFSNLNIIEW